MSAGKEAARVVRYQSETGDLRTSELVNSSISALDPLEGSQGWEESRKSFDASSESNVESDDDLDFESWRAALCPPEKDATYIRSDEASEMGSSKEMMQDFVVNAVDQALFVQLAYTAEQVAKGHTALPRFIVLQPQFLVQDHTIILSVYANAAGLEGHMLFNCLGLGPITHQNDRTEESGGPSDESNQARGLVPEQKPLWDRLLCSLCGNGKNYGDIWVPSFCEIVGFFGLIFGVTYLDYTHMIIAAITLHSLSPV